MDVLNSIFECLGLRSDTDDYTGLCVGIPKDVPEGFRTWYRDDNKKDDWWSCHDSYYPRPRQRTDPDTLFTSHYSDAAVLNIISIRAEDFVDTVVKADRIDDALRHQLRKIFEYDAVQHEFAAAVLARFENLIESRDGVPGVPMQYVVHESMRLVREELEVYDMDTAWCSLVAVGVMVVVAPWALEVLGFAEPGTLEGSWAAYWQSTYLSVVPNGALCGFLQRMSMVRGR